MAEKYLEQIVEPFFLPGGLLHGVADVTDQPHNLGNGELVQLRHPGGTVIEAKCWTVRSTVDPSFALANPTFRRPLSFYLEGLGKEDTPAGTQAWKN